MTRTTFSRFAWGGLAYNLAVILWGAYVRATGSGAGCGNHWPLCNGDVVPRSPGVETLIEYSHRLTSGVVLLFAIALLVLSRRLFPAGHRVRLAAVLYLVITLVEAALGAGLVLFGLVEDNDSVARAVVMSIHLGNTFLLIGSLTLTAYWGSGGAALNRPLQDPLASRIWLSLAGTTLVGMSGAIAALGDTLFPAESLVEGFRQDLSASSHFLIQLRTYHPLLAFAVSLLLLHLIARVRAEKRPQPARRFASYLNVAVLSQLALGALNVVLLAPVWMQLVHLLLADLLWISLVLTCAAALAVPAPETASRRSAKPETAATLGSAA
ncbi:MAG: COX15/CtaA family protein [Acidobacteriota bacterium]